MALCHSTAPRLEHWDRKIILFPPLCQCYHNCGEPHLSPLQDTNLELSGELPGTCPPFPWGRSRNWTQFSLFQGKDRCCIQVKSFFSVWWHKEYLQLSGCTEQHQVSLDWVLFKVIRPDALGTEKMGKEECPALLPWLFVPSSHKGQVTSADLLLSPMKCRLEGVHRAGAQPQHPCWGTGTVQLLQALQCLGCLGV